MSSTQSGLDSFWERVTKTDTCWLWTGSMTRDGYGQWSNKDSVFASRRVHRISYEIAHGHPPETEIDHLCRVRNCVNPDHLEAVTRSVNVQRSWDARAQTHCNRGHEWTPENTRLHARGRACRECGRIDSLAYYYRVGKKRVQERNKRKKEVLSGTQAITAWQ